MEQMKVVLPVNKGLGSITVHQTHSDGRYEGVIVDVDYHELVRVEFDNELKRFVVYVWGKECEEDYTDKIILE